LKKALTVLILLLLMFFFGKEFIHKPSTHIPEPSQASDTDINIQIKTENMPKKNIYQIEVDYDGKNIILGNMNIKYYNKSDRTHTNLFFHMYANIFKSRNHLPFFSEDLSKVFPQGFNPGGLEVLEAVQEGKPIQWTLEEDDQILQINLKDAVKPGNHTDIFIKFRLTLPNANFRLGYQQFGHDKITTSLGNWYPILAVFENGEWILDTHCSMGDPGYSDISDYNVEFTTPLRFTVAASGILSNHVTEGNKEIYNYVAENVRDFAAAISNNYEIAEDMVDGIKIISYFHPEDSKGGFMALDTVKHALKIFNDSFGKYPYDELRIAEANYYCGGMEYPTFIMMNTGKYKEPNLSNTSLERSTAHEVAHQWWYGVVGNNQVRESWIDEGLTEFSTAYYFEKRYGEAGREAYFERYVDTARNIIQNSTMKMYDPLPQFKIRGEYFPVVYINGMLFYDSLRSQIDDEHFFYLLKTYYEKYKYKNVNMVQLIKFLKERTQDVLDDTFFEKWFSLE
jgi:hypothetical protein